MNQDCPLCGKDLSGENESLRGNMVVCPNCGAYRTTFWEEGDNGIMRWRFADSDIDISPWRKLTEVPEGGEETKVLACWWDGRDGCWEHDVIWFDNGISESKRVRVDQRHGDEIQWFWMPLPEPPKGEKV